MMAELFFRRRGLYMNTFPSLVSIGLLGTLLASHAPAQEWTRFRGPNGSGTGKARTIPLVWTDKDYNWKVRLPGVGHSCPVLWGERLFVTSAEEETGKRTLLCLNAGDGRRLWAREFAGSRHGKHRDNSFASSTPAVDERHVYVCWANAKEYRVIALSYDGKETWRTDVGTFQSGHGFGASPIVHENMVILANDQDGPGFLIALESKSGKVRWRLSRRSRATYTTPCIYRSKDKPAQLIFTNYEHGVTALDPRTGKIVWELDVFDKRHMETAIGSPIVAGDLVLASCGWLGVRQEMVAVRPPGGEPQAKAMEVYRIGRSPSLCTTPLVVGELLFLWGDGGIVTCADLHSGKEYWRERVPGSYYASPVRVGERLYNISRDGDVVVLAASQRYQLLARNRVGEGSHSTPAVAGGKMYLRTFTHLISLGGNKTRP
jgi:outer membrane protein assembly factor BamB